MDENNKILLVDDNKSIHDDYINALHGFIKDDAVLTGLETILFSKDETKSNKYRINEPVYQIDHAYLGEQAVQMVKKSITENSPYAMAFVDGRMPPGMDGITTIAKIWEIDPYVEVVICTAYSDYSWKDIVEKLGISDRLLILKKPFDIIEVKQIALALIRKWNLSYQQRLSQKILEIKVAEQTSFITSMFEFANELYSLDDLDLILDCIILKVIQMIPCDSLSIMLLDAKGEYLTTKKSHPKLPENAVPLKPDLNIARMALRLGKPIVLNGDEAQTHHPGIEEYRGCPFLCAPLLGHGDEIGVVNIIRFDKSRRFLEDDIKTISYIGYTSAIAINNQVAELKLKNGFIGTIKALADAVEAKDYYTGSHSERVADLSMAIRNELGSTDEELNDLYYAAILHDIGKIGIPESILCKKGKLTNEEYEIIKKHPVIGEAILSNIAFFDDARKMIRHHHERMDGSGYPDRLTGDNICLGARIIAVADSFDAMNSDRVYREKKPLPVIKQELIEYSSLKLDKNCVDALICYLDKTIE